LIFLRAFWLAPLVAGVLMWASFPPLDQGWLNPIAWAVLFASMRLRRGARAGWQVFVASLVLFVLGFSWIRPLVWPMWFVVAFWCAMWEGLWARFVARPLLAAGDRPHAAWIVLLPASHLFADMLRTTVLSGFPWMLSGYSGWRNPALIGSADLIGVHGATLAILVTGACVAEAFCRAAQGGRVLAACRAFVPALLVWVAIDAWALMKEPPDERPGPTLLLLQPNIQQLLKEDALKRGDPRPTAATLWTAHENLAEAAFARAKEEGRRIDVVVWAETMVPAAAVRPIDTGKPMTTYVMGRSGRPEASHAERSRLVAASRGAWTLAGIQSVAEDGGRGRLFNTVVALDPEGRVAGFQDKQHLTPGGEYVPLIRLIPFRASLERYLEEMVGFLPDLERGESGNVVPLPAGGRTGVMICYESLFPELPREMVRGGANMLVNCSNYGWFAGTPQMEQALAVCAFRAAELRRPLVLASNNGISALIGPDGRVRGTATAADTAASLVVDVPLCDSTSPFALVGEWAAWAIGALAAVLCRVGARNGKDAVN
jgi:apolipoprotein N-acyltransferase